MLVKLCFVLIAVSWNKCHSDIVQIIIGNNKRGTKEVGIQKRALSQHVDRISCHTAATENSTKDSNSKQSIRIIVLTTLVAYTSLYSNDRSHVSNQGTHW